MKRIDFGSERWGWYAYAENDVLVIGESFPHEGGDLYSGDYRGDNTPYLMEIKKDCLEIYNKIVKYFEVDIKESGEVRYLSDMERLKKVFESCNPRSMDRNLYYAVLAVVNKEKRNTAINYFKMYSREYLA